MALAELVETTLLSARRRLLDDAAPVSLLVGYRAGTAQAIFPLPAAGAPDRATLVRIRDTFDDLGIDRYCAVLEPAAGTPPAAPGRAVWVIAGERRGPHVIHGGLVEPHGIEVLTAAAVPGGLAADIVTALSGDPPDWPRDALYVPH